ncbi:uncharacterized protein DFL_006516 [Arthrobotrys flagrans]|uniref:Alcohol acetyltransferase FCK4 n=1 Tax=Arthrobotrys flagrans TaxID=97331 RepID=A0A437A156_ARTFL|nr:hypothetical protein DFL_006516 [Arthrobotrys flagrans]
MAHNSDTSLPHGLVLVREATRIDNYFYMLTLTGSQAPIVVAASYAAHDLSKKLSRNHVIRAIERVVAKQPALGQVFVRQPSKQGKDQLWLARLPSLNVEDCISFINNDEADPAEASRRMLENIMGQWFNLLDTSKPHWRATVVNMKTIYFAFNHIVCDGRSGMYFHRDLLTALNDIEGEKDIPPPQRFTTCADAFPDHLEETIAKYNTSYLLWFVIKYILQIIVEFLLWPRYITYKDMKKYPHKPNIKQMAPPEERIKNKIVSLRIGSETMQKILTECRLHSTTFTAFLDTALNTSVCADIYPQALLVRASIVIDLRNFCKWPYEEVMCNMGGSWTKIRLAGPFSAIGKPPGGNLVKGGIYTDIPAFWTMAKYRKDNMNKYLRWGAIQEFLSLAVTSPYIDDFTYQVWGKSLSTTRNYGSLISNLVSLTPREEDKGREWRFTDTDWASSTHRSCIGPSLNITVTSAPGADCVINFIYHEGSYDPEVIPRIVEVVKARIGQIVSDNGKGLTMRV